MQAGSRRNAWCDIFEGRTGNKDLGRFSLALARVRRRYGDTSWETNAFEVASASTATRFRERVVSSFLPCGISRVFSQDLNTRIPTTAPGLIRSLARPAWVPLRVLRDSSLCHTFRLPTLPWKSRYIDTFEGARRHRLDFRDALSRGKVLLLRIVDGISFYGIRSISPYIRIAVRNFLLSNLTSSIE